MKTQTLFYLLLSIPAISQSSDAENSNQQVIPLVSTSSPAVGQTFRITLPNVVLKKGQTVHVNGAATTPLSSGQKPIRYQFTLSQPPHPRDLGSYPIVYSRPLKHAAAVYHNLPAAPPAAKVFGSAYTLAQEEQRQADNIDTYDLLYTLTPKLASTTTFTFTIMSSDGEANDEQIAETTITIIP